MPKIGLTPSFRTYIKTAVSSAFVSGTSSNTNTTRDTAQVSAFNLTDKGLNSTLPSSITNGFDLPESHLTEAISSEFIATTPDVESYHLGIDLPNGKALAYSNGGSKIIVTFLDGMGLEEKTFEINLDESSTLYRMIQNPSNPEEVILFGYITNGIVRSDDALILSVNKDGVVKSKVFGTDEDDSLNSGISVDNTTIYAIGATTVGQKDKILLIEFDSTSLELKSTRSIGSTMDNYYPGAIFAVGDRNDPANKTKLALFGRYRTYGNSDETFSYIEYDIPSNAVISHTYVNDIDSAGMSRIQTLPDGGYLRGATLNSRTTNLNAALLRYSSNGTVLGMIELGAYEDDVLTSITPTVGDGVYAVTLSSEDVVSSEYVGLVLTLDTTNDPDKNGVGRLGELKRFGSDKGSIFRGLNSEGELLWGMGSLSDALNDYGVVAAINLSNPCPSLFSANEQVKIIYQGSVTNSQKTNTVATDWDYVPNNALSITVSPKTLDFELACGVFPSTSTTSTASTILSTSSTPSTSSTLSTSTSSKTSTATAPPIANLSTSALQSDDATIGKIVGGFFGAVAVVGMAIGAYVLIKRCQDKITSDPHSNSEDLQRERNILAAQRRELAAQQLSLDAQRRELDAKQNDEDAAIPVAVAVAEEVGKGTAKGLPEAVRLK